ncbi:Protein artemis [Candida viswanathii]|uniref:Protein artemis n=1 Tax=Candida viswanathii TaxID=5486 RepID=A0A367YNW0_9ASCO|nr:Protein artemis [Candida viswanathii]
MNLGNTFHGEIYEFPGVYLDKFNNRGEVFLLTHSHQDHLQGLLNKSFFGRVYCSSLTKEIVALEDRYKPVLPYLVAKEYNEPFEIETRVCKLTVTLIPSYHCPGSVMFLLEGIDKAVLATGDIRAEAWWASTLIKNTYLFPYITGLKVLDQIYIDTTFSYRGEPYISIMPNSEGVYATIELLKLYPVDDEIQFMFIDAVSGSEEAWFQIVNYFDGELRANDLVTRRNELLKKHRDFYSPIKTSFKTGPIFNVGTPRSPVPVLIIIKHAINFNVIDYAGQCLPRRVSDIDPADLTCLATTSRGHKVFEHEGRQWILPKGQHELLPTGIMLMFSRHSSFEETRNFIDLFRPRLVYPCTESRATWLNGFTVARVFGDLCVGDTNHRFDLDKFERFGYPLPQILDRDVASINRWSFSQCLHEVDFVHMASERPFKGQLLLIPRGATKETKKMLSKEFKLQNLIAGRNEEKFKEVIEYHKTLRANPVFRKLDYHSSSYGSESSYEEVRTYSDEEEYEEGEMVSESQNVPCDTWNQTLTATGCAHLSPFLDNNRIQVVSAELSKDKRNWNQFKLKSTTPQI